MKKGFWAHIYESLIRIRGIYIAVVGGPVLSGIFFYFSDVQDKGLYTTFILLAFLLILALITLLDATYQALQKANFPLPKVVYSKTPPDEYSDVHAVILLEPSELFSYEQTVSVYIKEDQIELYIGSGHIANIQTDGKILMLLTSVVNLETPHLAAIKRNDVDMHKKMLIKPSKKSNVSQNGSPT